MVALAWLSSLCFGRSGNLYYTTSVAIQHAGGLKLSLLALACCLLALMHSVY